MSSKKDSTKVPRSKAKTAFGLLSEVRALILEEPKRYDQWATLHVRPENYEGYDYFPTCGTVGCVAGWVASLKSPKAAKLTSVFDYAGRVLGITSAQRDELFDGSVNGATRSQTVEHAEAGAQHIARFQRKYRAQLMAKTVRS